MILPAQEIEKNRFMIEPFCKRTVWDGMTYGLGPAGYDVRIAETILLKPGAFALASTVERFRIPDHIAAFVLDKSSWARRGLSLFNTVLEPGWQGWLTLELANLSSKSIEIREGSPIAQIMFHQLSAPTEHPYGGKYQYQQQGPQPAIEEK